MKKRLDHLVVERGLAETRSRAQALIMARKIRVDGHIVDKAGVRVDQQAQVESDDDGQRFVSRGGEKLQALVEAFDIDFRDRVVVDVGASTGGFTDCALSHGARKVYAIDVGYGQLAWKLRQDERVQVFERTNIREFDASLLDELCDVAVIDCSFISLRLVLPATLPLLRENACLIALIKPQFEAGRENVGKGGVVRCEETRKKTIADVLDFAATMGLELVHGMDSPVHGPSGNIEYLAYFQRGRVDQS